MHWTIPLLGWTVNPVLIAFGIAVIYKLWTRKKYRLPPGPLALPLIGNMIQILLTKKKLYKTFIDWIEHYGPIFTVHLGQMHCVVLNNIDLVLEATVKKPTEFAGRPHSYSMDYFSMGRRDIVLADYGPTWKLQRKIAFQAMRNYVMGENLEKKVHKSFEKVANILKDVKEPISVNHYISLIIYNFISGFCWGQSYELDDKEFINLMELADVLNNEFADGLPEDVIPILQYFPSSKREKMKKYVNDFYAIIREKFEQHQKTFNPDEIRDFIDDILLTRWQAEEENKELLAKLTDTHLFLTITDIFGGGTDTSRYTLMWAIYYMILHPEVQDRIHSEIDKNIGHGRLPGLKDKENLAYTEATLHETMRIASITPMGIPHAALVDATLGGYDIPKGTVVFFNIWALHMDSQYWQEPQKFEPERFLEADGTHAPKPTSFLPFGAGRRVCLGEAVAKPELLMLFACLLQRFKFQAEPGKDLTLNEVSGAFTNITPPFKVVVTSRV